MGIPTLLARDARFCSTARTEMVTRFSVDMNSDAISDALARNPHLSAAPYRTATMSS